MLSLILTYSNIKNGIVRLNLMGSCKTNKIKEYYVLVCDPVYSGVCLPFQRKHLHVQGRTVRQACIQRLSVLPTRSGVYTRLHGVKPQTIAVFIFTAVRTSNPTRKE
jgi:hypothetical protein